MERLVEQLEHIVESNRVLADGPLATRYYRAYMADDV